MKILGIAGSLRAASHNARLLRGATRLLPLGVTLQPWSGLGTLPHFNEDIEHCDLPGVAALRAALGSADGLLIATPEYNATVPGALKNAVDWASRPPGRSPLRGVPVAVIGASTGRFGAVWAQAELRKALAHAGARVVTGELAVPMAPESIDEDGRLSDPGKVAALVELLAELVRAADGRRRADRARDLAAQAIWRAGTGSSGEAKPSSAAIGAGVSPRFTAAEDISLMQYRPALPETDGSPTDGAPNPPRHGVTGD